MYGWEVYDASYTQNWNASTQGSLAECQKKREKYFGQVHIFDSNLKLSDDNFSDELHESFYVE